MIIDRWHPQHGQSMRGKVLLMASGRGSSSGSAVLAEAIRLGTGPVAIVLLKTRSHRHCGRSNCLRIILDLLSGDPCW
ncbi:MAG: DUF126 domain-containing protein [Nitratireductor sp.]